MVNTHRKIDKRFSGEVLENSQGYAKVLLKTTQEMITDDEGLIHGGFTFSAADYAAMVAVNKPNVVLLGADVKFTAPVMLGDSVEFVAKVESTNGRKAIVEVVGAVETKEVFRGVFTTYVTKEHILALQSHK